MSFITISTQLFSNWMHTGNFSTHYNPLSLNYYKMRWVIFSSLTTFADIITISTSNKIKFNECKWHYQLTFNSSRVKPRPARTLVLYLNVGHLTIGLSGPATGRGATVLAFLILFVLRRCFLIGWLNHVLTLLCQSLWKCPLGTILFRLRAMVAARYQKID